MFFFNKKKSKEVNEMPKKVDGFVVIKKNEPFSDFPIYEIDPFVDLTKNEIFLHTFLDFLEEKLPATIAKFLNKPVFDKRHPFFDSNKGKTGNTAFQKFSAFLFLVLALSFSAFGVKAAFSGYNDPPVVASEPVVEETAGKVDISWVTSRDATSYVYFGTSSEELSQNKGSSIPTKNHLVSIDGLMPSTTYFYKIQSYDTERNYDTNEALSGVYIFKTDESKYILDVSTDDITADAITISWKTVVLSKAVIEYGKTEEYGLKLNVGDDFEYEHTKKITSLEPGTIYHYRISSISTKDLNFLSSDYQFMTNLLPSISGVKIEPVSDDSVASIIVEWKTNIPTDSYVSYQTNGHLKNESDNEFITEHYMDLYDVTCDSEYIIVISGKDEFGNIVSSESHTIKTAKNLKAPKISDVYIENNSLGIGSEAVAQLIVTWKTDTPSTSQIQYGSGNSTSLDKEIVSGDGLTTNHIVLVSGLDLSQIYTLRPVSRDENDNISYGEERVIVTQDSESSVLEIVIDVLNRIFGE